VKPILIIDYSVDGLSGATIARRLDTGSAIARVEPGEVFPDVSPDRFSGLIHSGSALSITRNETFTLPACSLARKAVEKGVPQMGICYGHQLLCLALLGDDAVERAREGPEIGWLPVEIDTSLVPGAQPRETVWQSHYDRVNRIPPEARMIAGSPHTRIQGFVDTGRKLLGTQFHPEFTRETGNIQFGNDTDLLLRHGIDPRGVLAMAPERDAGAVFFDYFLHMIRGEV
jgi:GMP synthase (glutamine-hydrolysing)